MAVYYATAKAYGKAVKLVCMNFPPYRDHLPAHHLGRGEANDEKLVNNIIRARGKVFEYAMCNDWEYFVTLTIDGKKHDRYNLKQYIKDLGAWLKNYSQRKLPDSVKLRYLLVPEMHKDGAWHLHGLFMGLPLSHLTRNEHGYLDWLPYRDKFGYISFDHIRNKTRCAWYISKYVSKDMIGSCRELNSQLYYCTKGLQTAETLEKNVIVEMPIDGFSYKNEWCGIRWFDDLFQFYTECGMIDESMPEPLDDSISADDTADDIIYHRYEQLVMLYQ